MNLFYCSPRQRSLLNFLASSNDWVTGPQLAKLLNVSDRTIRNDVGILNYVLEQYNSSIISKHGKGYKIQTNNKELILAILSQYEGGESEKKKRFYEIVTRLLFSEDGVDLYDLEDDMYISRTTLENEIRDIKKMLEDFYPSIYINRKRGKLKLIGSEASIRFLLNEILMLKYDMQTQKMFVNNQHFEMDEYEWILQNVIDITSEYYLIINDQWVADIAAYLLITKKRISCNKKLDCHDYHEIDKNDIVNKISYELYCRTIKNDSNINEYDLIEIKQISVKLSFINLCIPFDITKAEAVKQVSPQILLIVNSLIDNIKNDFQLDLSNDDELFMGLVFHIKALMNRVKYQQMVDSPILEIIKKQYPFIFELSLHIYEIFDSVLKIQLTEGELSYVAAHIAAGIERMGLNSSKAMIKVAVVTHLVNSYAQLLMSQVKSVCDKNVKISGPYPVYKIKEIIKEKPSIILSTIKPELYIEDVRIVEVGAIMSDEEQMILRKTIDEVKEEQLFNVSYFDKSIRTKFNKRFFYPKLNLSTPQEVIGLLSNEMILSNYVPDYFLKEVLEREKLASTVLDNMIAVPHPVKACAYKTVIGVAALQKPILWEGNKVQLVLLLAIKQEDKPYMREVFKFISKIMDDSKKVEELINAQSFKQFINSIKIISGEGNEQ